MPPGPDPSSAPPSATPYGPRSGVLYKKPVSPDHWIVYVDLDAFYVSCELTSRPELAGRPVIVGPPPTEGPTRGVVLSASYEARKFGVRSALPVAAAARLCPDATWIPPHFAKYERVSEEVRTVLRRFSSTVTPFSIDEAAMVLDVTDADAAGELAREIQRALATELHLPASIGVATTRLVAKIATDRAKPGGVRVVRPEEVASFVAPLPVRAVPGVGPKTEALLQAHQITTIGELASRSPGELARYVGALGRELVALARGRPIESSDAPAGPRVRSTDHTFATDADRWEDVEPAVRALAGSLGASLEREGLRYGVAGVSLRWADFSRSQHGRALSAAQEGPGALEAAAVRLARELWTLERQGRRRSVRTVSVRVERLSERAGRQARLDEYPTGSPATEDK